jgi:hypothetical protein
MVENLSPIVERLEPVRDPAAEAKAAAKNEEAEQAILKQEVIIEFGQMFIKYLKDSLDDFKDLIANEIEEVLNIDGIGSKENGDKAKGGEKQRMTMVMKNVPKSKNNEKGMLKHHKDVVKPAKSKSRDRKSSATGGNNPVAMKQIHPAHENFNMVLNIMLGIKKSVDSTLDIPLLNATDKDFNLKC